MSNSISGTSTNGDVSTNTGEKILPKYIKGKEDFKSTISNSLVLVDFWATWCSPCRMIAPVLEELTKEWAGRVSIAKLQLDDPSFESEHQGLAMEYGVMGIPTLILFNNGVAVERMTGAYPKAAFTNFLTQNYEKYSS